MNGAANASASAGGAASLGVILVWLLKLHGVDTPPEVALALGSLVTGVAACIVHLLTRVKMVSEVLQPQVTATVHDEGKPA